MKTYPFYPRRKTTDLNGLWDFTFPGKDAALESLDVTKLSFNGRMPVPSAFDAYPGYAGKRGVAVYRTRLDITPGARAAIDFQSAGMRCRIYIDGVPVMSHHPSYVNFVCDVPRSQSRSRELAVAVDNRFDTERNPLQESYFDFYQYGGIFRGVTLFELPETFIAGCRVTPADIKSGVINVCVSLGGDIPDKADFTVSAGEKYHFELKDITVKDSRASFSLALPGAALWSPESPALHTLSVRHGSDEITERFGMRTVRAEAGKILLNGKPVKLLGVCRHEAHPQFGPALPFQQLVQDIYLLKNMGCNFVRGAHYQQDRRFLSLCDEFGVMVFEESLGWGQKKNNFLNPAFTAGQLGQTRAMIENGYNHPCVIMRGFLNEGESDAEEARGCYESLIKLIRDEDPSRLVTYASFKRRTDLFLPLVDVICFNTYPGWYNADGDEDALGQILPKIRSDIEFIRGRSDLRDKPFILSEIGGAALYGWKDPMDRFWTEEYQAELLETVCREVVDNDEFAGVSIWQFFDCRTYNCGRAIGRPRAFNNKGILDEYRRPKLAYERVRRIFSGK
jgi:beta-glucuronidase